MISGITLSEWYANRLTALWVRRSDPLSAHYMMNEGINLLLSALFALNGELLADHKWRMYCADKLRRVPPAFRDQIGQVLRMDDASLTELTRRKNAFMDLWGSILPDIET